MTDRFGIFFTSDHHFSHTNIIRFTGRPFATVTEMDQVLIDRWNERVGPDDVVYHLGDLTLGPAAGPFIRQLNGRLRILANTWHHDRRWLEKEWFNEPLSKSWHVIELLMPLVVLSFPELGNDGFPLKITLCHYPLAEWEAAHYGAWHLHGHSHGKHQASGRILDVGVDSHNFYPVSLEEVIQLMQSK